MLVCLAKPMTKWVFVWTICYCTLSKRKLYARKKRHIYANRNECITMIYNTFGCAIAFFVQILKHFPISFCFHTIFLAPKKHTESYEIYKHAKFYTWVHWNYFHGSGYSIFLLKVFALFLKSIVYFVRLVGCGFVFIRLRSCPVLYWMFAYMSILFAVCIDVVTAR